MLQWKDNTNEDKDDLIRARKQYNRKKIKLSRCQCDCEYGGCPGVKSCPYSDYYEEDNNAED